MSHEIVCQWSFVDSSFDTERVNFRQPTARAKNGGTVYHDIGSNGGGDNFGGYILLFCYLNRMLTASERDLATRSVIKSYTTTATGDGVYVANNLRVEIMTLQLLITVVVELRRMLL